MEKLLKCEDCGWCGQGEECIKEYRGTLGGWDVEAVPMCPKCNSKNLIELDTRGAVLEPSLV